jgi:adenylate cyclase
MHYCSYIYVHDIVARNLTRKINLGEVRTVRPRTRRKLRFALLSSAISTVACTLVGAIVVAAARSNPLYMMKVVVMGTLLGFVLPASDVFFLSRVLRRYRFTVMVVLKALGLSLVALTVYIAGSVALRPLVPWSFNLRELAGIAVTNLVICSIYSSVAGVNRLLGRRVLASFVTGRYFHPVEEARVFMFLDLTSSTTIAEKIGNVRFHRLLHEFFSDVAEAVIDSGGEIYKYVGDEVIVTWKLADGIRNASCIRCYVGICDIIDDAHEKYERRFGLVPRFAAGMHCGTVIAGEMGEDRAEIAFLGDVVNTCARIQAECKAKGERLLLSQDLYENLTLPGHLKAREVGRTKLRGKEQEIGLYTIDTEEKLAASR